MSNDSDRPLEGWHMIRVEHPTPIVYTFGPEIDPYTWHPMPSTFRFFATVKDFDRAHGKHETNKRAVIRHCTALTFAARMTEPFRVVKDDVFEGNNLLVNGATLARIIIHHMRAKPDLAFEEKEFKLFFEPYSNAKNEAIEWFETEAPETLEIEARKAHEWFVRKPAD